MKITAIHIEGFGVWSGLKLERLSDGLNVLYGPNEAGKTTLLQFIRGVLYGYTSSRRKYFPPVRGGRPGGLVEIAGPNGRFEIQRHEEEGAQRVTLTAADGTRQGEHLIKVLLADVDETIFTNVFAVGLREMQELGTLSDTQAAELLYNLTAGLDRVSLVEVTRELETSRNRILDRQGRPCQVVQLLADREKLRLEIDELRTATRRYERLAAERNKLQREVTRLEEDQQQTQQHVRAMDLAGALRPRWLQRAGLDEQLAALGTVDDMPKDALARLEAINARLQTHRRRRRQLARRRTAIRAEAAALTVNENLWRQSARIAALREQEPWLSTLQTQVATLEREIAQAQSALTAEHQRLGLDVPADGASLGWEFNSHPNTLNSHPNTLAKLRGPARALRDSRGRLDQAQQEAAKVEATALDLAQQIETALASRNQRELAGALDQAGSLVTQYRHRLQLDERLDQMSRYQSELGQQSQRLTGRQLLPAGVLAGLGAVFVLGVVLVLAGLFLPASITGTVGWWMALLGLAGCGAAGLGKVLLERTNARQLESCQKQLTMLQAQIQQAKDERDGLDKQLPRGGGPMAARLDAAEKDLAALEELVPLDGRRTAAEQEAQAAARRVEQAKEELTATRRRWQSGLAAAGLPENLTPKHLHQLRGRSEQIAQLQRRIEHGREELQHRRKELDTLVARIAQLAADTGVVVAPMSPVEQLAQLAAAVAEQDSRFQRRDALRRQSRQLRRKQTKHAAALGRFRQRRRQLLRQAGAADEQDLRRRADAATRAQSLRAERDAISREIAAACLGQCGEEAIRQQIERQTPEALETRRRELAERVATLDKQLQDRFEKRGQIAEQMKALAEDRRLAARQLDLAVIERRLEEAIRRWQVLAVAGHTLELVRTNYEQHRQPETLQEASGYLDRLTQGRYRRVWTPLGENVLRVDDAEGNSLAVESLSRGTREQLFLALRLALAACYARRGAALPLVLDDVLVNFDADRAKAAAAVLRDFAATGHQLLVFTCHEHIQKLFKSLKVPVNTLPDNSEAEHAVLTFEEPAARKPPSKPRKPPARTRKPIVEVEEEEEEDEVVEEEPEEEVAEEPEEEEEPDEPEDEDEELDDEEDDEAEDEDAEEDLWEEGESEELWEEDDEEYDDDAEAA